MQLKTAKAIVQAAAELGLEISLYENYSGRGMYGETTTAVTGDRSDITEAAVSAKQTTRFRWDSLGKSSVAY